ncbi:MAG TPA: hypothetical protein DCL77_08005 [Prolixibacteraceae bacterium]|nr:hypothetical protein [Prolixibacteraceae bacterium]
MNLSKSNQKGKELNGCIFNTFKGGVDPLIFETIFDFCSNSEIIVAELVSKCLNKSFLESPS